MGNPDRELFEEMTRDSLPTVGVPNGFTVATEESAQGAAHNPCVGGSNPSLVFWGNEVEM